MYALTNYRNYKIQQGKKSSIILQFVSYTSCVTSTLIKAVPVKWTRMSENKVCPSSMITETPLLEISINQT